MIKRLLNLILGEDNTCCKEDTKPEINNISEPVISFLKCFKDNPKRFKLSSCWCTMEMSRCDTQVYFIDDKEEGITYKYSRWPSDEEPPACIDISAILNKDEIKHIEDTFITVFEDRWKRYNQILKQRKQRERVKLRNRLTEIYQKGC